MPQGAEHQRGAEAHHDDADVFDAVIGQQPLEVVLLQRVEHAHQRRDHAHGENHGPGPQRRRPEEVEEYARHPVDAALDHDARHQRRDVAGRHRVRVRQPDMQRHDAGLHAEPREEQQEDRALLRREEASMPAGGSWRNPCCRRTRASSRKAVSSITVPACDMMRYTTAALRVSAFSCSKRHQAEGRHRHHFPGRQEEERVRRREDQGQAQQQGIVEEAQRAQIARALHGTQIPERIHRHRQRQKRQGERKPGRQRIEPHRAGEERDQRQTRRWRWWAGTGRGTQPPPEAGCPARQSRMPQPARPPRVSTWRGPRWRLPGTTSSADTQKRARATPSVFRLPIHLAHHLDGLVQIRLAKMAHDVEHFASTGFGRE